MLSLYIKSKHMVPLVEKDFCPPFFLIRFEFRANLKSRISMVFLLFLHYNNKISAKSTQNTILRIVQIYRTVLFLSMYFNLPANIWL